jgi:hypothetical protein
MQRQPCQCEPPQDYFSESSSFQTAESCLGASQPIWHISVIWEHRTTGVTSYLQGGKVQVETIHRRYGLAPLELQESSIIVA